MQSDFQGGVSKSSIFRFSKCICCHVCKVILTSLSARRSVHARPLHLLQFRAGSEVHRIPSCLSSTKLPGFSCKCVTLTSSHVTEVRGASGYWPQPYDNSRACWCLCSYQVIRARTWIFNILLPAQIAELSRFVCCKLEATSIYHLFILLLLSNTTSAPQQLTNFFTHSTDLLFPQISSLGCPVGGFLAISFSATPQTVWSLN